jgi:uncharacterized protein (UPF0276 family)
MVKGVGFTFRPDFANTIDETLERADFLEVITAIPEYAEVFRGKVPCIIHSLELSLGSDGEINLDELNRVKGLVNHFESPLWSDHLSFTSIDNDGINSFLPLPYTDESIEIAVKNIKHAKSFVDVPLILENITHSFTWSNNVYSDGEFFSRVITGADCGILLDIANLFINSKNHKYDPYEFLNQLPLERITKLHVAAYDHKGGRYIDTHIAGLQKEIIELVDWVLKHTPVNLINLEREAEVNHVSELDDDLEILRTLYRKYR